MFHLTLPRRFERSGSLSGLSWHRDRGKRRRKHKPFAVGGTDADRTADEAQTREYRDTLLPPILSLPSGWREWNRYERKEDQMFGHGYGRGGFHRGGSGPQRPGFEDFVLGEEGRGHRHGEGHGASLGRLFAHGNLHLAALYLIAEKPRHGYEIIKVIADMVGGVYSPSPGTIYPALSMLEDQGYVTVEASEGARKLYAITAAGKTYLQENQAEVDALLARIKAAAQLRAAAPPATILRAMANLKLALQLRLAQDEPTPEQIRAIAGILDQAVGEIEKI